MVCLAQELDFQLIYIFKLIPDLSLSPLMSCHHFLPTLLQRYKMPLKELLLPGDSLRVIQTILSHADSCFRCLYSSDEIGLVFPLKLPLKRLKSNRMKFADAL